MSRSDLKILDGGFPVYGDAQLRKINAMRRAFSAPDSLDPVVNTKGEALFVTGEEMNNEPSSCYNCQFYNEKVKTCGLIGPRKIVLKFVWPKEATADSKQIEYWPDCSMHLFGETNKGAPVYYSNSDPDYIGLIWINAPKPGLPHGGANCGGANGGDDCDHYTTDGEKPKWESPTGFCRALQTTVACNDDCAQWRDDDTLQWQDAQRLIKDLGYYDNFHPEISSEKRSDNGVQRWALAFVGGKDTKDEPKSCFDCNQMYLKQKRCMIHGPDIVIDRVKKDGKVYTPVCCYQRGGVPLKVEKAIYNATTLGEKAADQTGLEWAESPTGTNCGGYKQGADCKHFSVTSGNDGICLLMSEEQDAASNAMSEHKGREVDWDDCCDGHEGKNIPWREAQKLLKGANAAS